MIVKLLLKPGARADKEESGWGEGVGSCEVQCCFARSGANPEKGKETKEHMGWGSGGNGLAETTTTTVKVSSTVVEFGLREATEFTTRNKH